MGSTAITRYQEGRGYDFLLPFNRMGYGARLRLFLWIKCELPLLVLGFELKGRTVLARLQVRSTFR
jgi:hypothetical protein